MCVGLAEYKAAYDAVDDVLTKCEILSLKVTDLQKSSVYCGETCGFSVAEISTMSKYVGLGTGKYDNA